MWACSRRASVRASLVRPRSEEHTSELQSHDNIVCRLLLAKKTRRAARSDRSPARPLGGARDAAPAGLPPPAAVPLRAHALCFFLRNRPPRASPSFPQAPPFV